MPFAILIRPTGDGGYWAEVPTLPGCVSQGATVDETIANTRSAIAGWLAYLRERGRTLPDPETLPVVVDVEA